MKKVLRVIRIIFGIELAVAALGGVISSVQNPTPGNIAATVFCAVIAFLLLRKRKAKEPESVENMAEIVPIEVIESVDAYIEVGNTFYRTDGKPISDREVPHLIEMSLHTVESSEVLFRRSDAEQELIFRFTQRYGTQSYTLTSKFENLASAAYKTSDLDERVALLTAALQQYQVARVWHYKISKGGMMWFQDMWENGHQWAETEASTLEETLRERDYIRPYILEKAVEGFIQKSIYAELPDAGKSEVQRVLRNMEKEGKIVRIKKSGSYWVTAA